MPIPTRRLAAVLAVASLAVLALPDRGLTSLLLVDGVVLAIALVDLLLTPAPGRIEVARDLPGVVSLGAEATIAWRLRSGSRRRVWVLVADELAPSLRAADRRVRIRLEPGEEVRASTTFRPARRGRFQPREVVVRVTGPLGLVSRQRARVLPGLLRVHPPFRSKEEAELRIDRARLLEVGLRSAAGHGGGTEFDQLRDYNVDDEFRRIDWSASARVDRPIVRTYRAERNQTVIVLLDNGRVMAGQVGDVPRVEHAMDAVMMLTAVATRLGDRAGLVAFDHEVRAVVSPGHGPGQLGRVTEAMYRPGARSGRERLPGRLHGHVGPVPAPGPAGRAHRAGRAGGGGVPGPGPAPDLCRATSWSSAPCRTPRSWRGPRPRRPAPRRPTARRRRWPPSRSGTAPSPGSRASEPPWSTPPPAVSLPSWPMPTSG